MTDSSQESINRRVYRSPLLVAAYARRRLRAAEQAFVDRRYNDISGARILEIGMGGGRITRHLLPLSRSDVGVDISSAMVAYCRRVLPTASFLVGDACDLAEHRSGSYDLVVAGANVLDVLSHEGRLQALAEIHRVLVAGGLFYFSSHNRNSRRASGEARQGPTLRMMKNPYRQARSMANYAIGTVNHRRLREYQRGEPQYAIWNDDAHSWRLLHYYIDRETQADQLDAAGFELAETLGMDGQPLEPLADDSHFTELHYIATRV